MIMELLEIGREIEEQTGKMYILSNVMRSYGACAMMYPDLLRKIGRRIGENYYILPSSSRMKTIIVAESEAPGKEELCEMIEEINETQVEEEEVLSNRAYYYKCDTGKLLF